VIPVDSHYSLIGPDLFLDLRGKLFTKVASGMAPVKNKFTDAEERFVKSKLEKEHEKR
jgi:hypothetical protein